jgi:hypothetical protein
MILLLYVDDLFLTSVEISSLNVRENWLENLR